MTETKPQVVIRPVKHTFTRDERGDMANEIGRQLGEKERIEGIFDQVKSSHKASITACENIIASLGANLRNGFEFRNEQCIMVLNPPAKKREYYIKEQWDNMAALDEVVPVFVEEMRAEDYQLELPATQEEELTPVAEVDEDKE